MDNEWLENFIQDYRKKLAGEKLELQLEEKPTAAEQRIRRRSPHHHHQEPEIVVTYRQTHPAAAANVAAAVEDDADAFFFRHCSTAQRSKEEERAERRRKQEDYRRCLDEQLAELRQRRERERNYRQASDDCISKVDFGIPIPLKFAGTNLQGSKTAPDLRNLPRAAVRSSSPPITSHYRGTTTSRATQTSIPRPFSSVSNRLSDLTELRQRYS